MIKLKDIIKEARFINPDKNDTSILKKYGLDQVETLLQSDDETTRKMASDHLIKAYKHSIHPDTEYMRVNLDPVEVAEYQDSLLRLIHKYVPDYIAEIRLTSDKSIFTLGTLTEKQFEEIRDDVDPYYFSSGQEGSLWEFMYSMVLNKLNNRQIANILNKQYNIGDEIDTYEEGMYATNTIIDKFNNFEYIVNLLDLEDIQLSKTQSAVTEVRFKSGGVEKQNKIVSYQDTGGPHEFFRYWKNDEHDSHVLYYTMSDRSTWGDDTEERFEVYKAYPSTFTMIATDLDEKDATHLAYKLAMDDPNGKFVKWNMSYSRFDLPI